MASVIIMDEKFRMIGETVFTDGQIGVYSYLNTKNGYLVSPQLNNEDNKTLNYKTVISFSQCKDF